MLLRNFSKVWRFCNSKQIRQGITKNGKDNLEVNQNNTTNNNVSNTSNDVTNHIQKMNEGNYDRQNAYWAYRYIQKIANCSNHNFPFLQQTLVNMKYDQLKCNEPINEKSHKYMKGFYDIFSKEGPLLDQIVFSQQRYQKGQGVLGTAQGRIVYYPTQITKNMFGLFRNRNTYAFVAGLRGIGKSFAIMQYCQLMNLIAKYRIQMRNKKLEQIFLSLPMLMDLKPFYWTIERNKKIKKESEAIKLVLNLWKIILAQCDSVFKQENKTVIQQLQKQLNQYITQQQEKQKGMSDQQIDIAIQKIARGKANKFNLACSNLEKLCELIKSFYKKQNINIILFIDQINTLASIFRQTKQALQKSQTKKFSELESDQQKEYVLGRVNDDLRIVLNSLSDYFFHNSSADLEKCYKYDNRNQKDDLSKMQQLSKMNLKMIYGNTHTNRQSQDLKFQSFFESQSYQQSMKNIFQFQIWKKMNVAKQFYQSKYGKQIQQIVRRQLDEKLYLFKIQPLLIRQGLKDFNLNKIQQIFTNILKLDEHMKSIVERKVNNMSDQNIVQNNSDIAKHYQNIAQVCKQIKVSQNILEAYEKISQIYRNNGNKQNIAKAYYNLAEAFRNIQDNQSIAQNYQNIAKAYQKGDTIEIMKNIYENIINIYETIIDQNLLNLQEQLNVNFQVIQNKITGKVQQDLKVFIAKNSTYVNQLFKNNTQLTLFFGSILKYLEMKLQMQQSKDDAKLQCLSIDLNKTNIFTELFKQKIKLNDKFVKKYICNELFYCKNLVLKSYVGEKVLCNALRNIFESQILNYNLFRNAQILTQITPLIRKMLGNFYEQLVLRQFSSCSKISLKYKTALKQEKKKYNINKISKVFLAFQDQNKVQQSKQKSKQKVELSKGNQIKKKNEIKSYSLSRFKDLISNQFKQKYISGQFDFCYPTLFQDGEKNIVKQNKNQNIQSEATDFILIGESIDNKYEINFFQVTVAPKIIQKLKKFGQLLSKIKQFYLPKPNFNSLFNIPTYLEFKINFFVVAASASQNQLYDKQIIFQSASAKISDEKQCLIFKKNLEQHFGDFGVVNFSNKSNNSIQIIHDGWIGTKTDVKNQEELVKKKNQQNQKKKKKEQNQKDIALQKTKKYKNNRRTRKL